MGSYHIFYSVEKNRMMQNTVVVALGGNAITREFEEGLIVEQFENTRQSLLSVIHYIRHG